MMEWQMVPNARDYGDAWSAGNSGGNWPEWLTTQEAKAYSRISDLARRRVSGDGPAYVKIAGRNGKILYQRTEIDRWLKARTRKSTSESTVLSQTAA
jgi:hypothetical protein